MTSAASRSILVVDDDHDMVDTLCDVLELKGWKTFRAYGGEDAIALATAKAVDWVIMDVRMPHVSGVEALKAIRKQRPDQRVVLMTAFASPEVRSDAARAGAFLLKKPFEPTALFSLLQ